MQAEPAVAFVTKTDPPALEIRVNFGIFAGRAATPAEIDELARAIIADVGEVSIVAEERHELTEEVEAALHQVRIEVAEERLPPAGEGRDRLAHELVQAAERWAEACIADRHAEVTEP